MQHKLTIEFDTESGEIKLDGFPPAMTVTLGILEAAKAIYLRGLAAPQAGRTTRLAVPPPGFNPKVM